MVWKMGRDREEEIKGDVGGRERRERASEKEGGVRERERDTLLILCPHIVAGAKEREEIMQAFNNIYPILKKFKKT